MLTFGFALPKTNAILRLNLLNLKACNLLIVYIGTCNGLYFIYDLRRAGLPAEFKHITKRRKRK